MYGLWHNDLNKWMIDRFNHETQEEDVALFKTKKEALEEADIINREWSKRNGKMTMKKTEEVKVKQYRKAKK
tara:strand:- start:235 stop:450 length:216 start_codon:yes stop_codon:yes gene_type:complete